MSTYFSNTVGWKVHTHMQSGTGMYYDRLCTGTVDYALDLRTHSQTHMHTLLSLTKYQVVSWHHAICVMCILIWHAADCHLSQMWTKMERLEGAPWPVERCYHAATCLNYGDTHPLLLVTGGVDKNLITLADAWILDIHSRSWREVRKVKCVLCTKKVWLIDQL